MVATQHAQPTLRNANRRWKNNMARPTGQLRALEWFGVAILPSSGHLQKLKGSGHTFVQRALAMILVEAETAV